MDIIVGIIIRPNATDDWETTPPFPNIPLAGSNGYLIANSDLTDPGFDDYKIVTGMSLSITNLVNEFDFLQKVIDDSSGRNISKGIGGLAKLKDWSFTLANRNDLFTEEIMGRTVELRFYANDVIVNDSDGFHTSIMSGLIMKPNVDNYKMTFNVQGVINNNNPRIAGTPYVDFNGNQITNWIFIGESQEGTYIKLNKVKTALGIQLAFDDEKYDLIDVYVKDKSIDEFYKITAKYTVENGLIYFTDTRKMVLAESVDEDRLDSSFLVFDHGYVGILFPDEVYPQTLVYNWDKNPEINLRKKEEYTEGGKTWGLYKCSQGFLYPPYFETLSKSICFGYTPDGSRNAQQVVIKQNPLLDWPYITEDLFTQFEDYPRRGPITIYETFYSKT